MGHPPDKTMHLAELNRSVWGVNPFSKKGREFVDNVDRMNALAERSPGFVWRMRDEGRDIRGRNPVCEDHYTIFTCSVWETQKDLEHFVWNTLHKRFFNRGSEWFKQMQEHHLVMWWVEEGHQPTLSEARERLDHLESNGNSDYAFTWSHLHKTN